MSRKDTSDAGGGRSVDRPKHAFSIELISKEHLKLVTIPKDVMDTVSIEGFLGELETVSLVEGAMLEIQGSYGSIKMDLKEEELKRLCVCHQNSENKPIGASWSPTGRKTRR